MICSELIEMKALKSMSVLVLGIPVTDPMYHHLLSTVDCIWRPTPSGHPVVCKTIFQFYILYMIRCFVCQPAELDSIFYFKH